MSPARSFERHIVVLHRSFFTCLSFVRWWLDAGATPGHIPNPEVKPGSADGTRKGRVGSRQRRELKHASKKARITGFF